MVIETTFMRYGHEQSGIIGITLKPETLKTWAYSLHTCHGIIDDLNEMRDNERPTAQTSHKEETAAIIKGDDQDRKALRDKLELCKDPLDPEQHPDGLMNIVTGQVVNHSKVQLLEKIQMESFERSWPGGFHDSIQKIVTTWLYPGNTLKSEMLKCLTRKPSMQELWVCSLAYAILTQPR